jgi:hypothetical protein
MRKSCTITLCAKTVLFGADSPIGSNAATLAYAQIRDAYVATKPGFGKSPIAGVYEEFFELGIGQIIKRYPKEAARALEKEISFRFAATDKYTRVTELTLDITNNPLPMRVAAWKDLNNALDTANHTTLQSGIPGFKARETHKDTIIANEDLQMSATEPTGKLFGHRSTFIASLLVTAFRFNFMETKDPEALQYLLDEHLGRIPTIQEITPEIKPAPSGTVWSMVASLFQRT